MSEENLIAELREDISRLYKLVDGLTHAAGVNESYRIDAVDNKLKSIEERVDLMARRSTPSAAVVEKQILAKLDRIIDGKVSRAFDTLADGLTDGIALGEYMKPSAS